MKRFICLAFLLCALNSCTMEEPFVINDNSIITFNGEGGSFSIDIKAVSNLIVTSNQDWCTALLGSDGNLIINVQKNDSKQARFATVYLLARNSQRAISITQNPAPLLAIKANCSEVPEEGGTITISVESNLDFQTRVGVDWITPINTDAQKTGSFNYAISKNPSYDDRSGEIEFKSISGSIDTVFRFTQKAARMLVVSPTYFDLSNNAAEITVTVTTNLNLDIDIDSDWIHMVEDSSGNKHSFTFEVDQNQSTSNRACCILFTDNESSLRDIVIVKQAATSFLEISDNFIPLESSSCSFSIDIYTNTDFIISCDATWIMWSTPAATASTSLTFSVSGNNSYAPRTANITFSYADGLEQTVIVRQSGLDAFIGIGHHADLFAAPILNGIASKAIIDWGDGTKEPYNDYLSHQYAQSGQQHVVTIKPGDAEGVTFSNIIEIDLLDFSSLMQSYSINNQ